MRDREWDSERERGRERGRERENTKWQSYLRGLLLEGLEPYLYTGMDMHEYKAKTSCKWTWNGNIYFICARLIQVCDITSLQVQYTWFRSRQGVMCWRIQVCRMACVLLCCVKLLEWFNKYVSSFFYKISYWTLSSVSFLLLLSELTWSLLRPRKSHHLDIKCGL